MRRSLCSRPKSAPARRRSTRRRRPWCLRSSRRSATRSWRRRLWRAPFRTLSVIPRGCVSSRLLWTVRQATLALAQRQIEALKAQRDSAVASLGLRKAQRDQAQLDLSHTIVTADQPGRVVQLSAAVGEFAQAGTNLSMFVPDDIWVWANFKESQLDYMRPRQRVTLEIDAYPERTIRAHVDSVQPGSGTAFTLLPVENATGNYVKIV